MDGGRFQSSNLQARHYLGTKSKFRGNVTIPHRMVKVVEIKCSWHQYRYSGRTKNYYYRDTFYFLFISKKINRTGHIRKQAHDSTDNRCIGKTISIF